MCLCRRITAGRHRTNWGVVGGVGFAADRQHQRQYPAGIPRVYQAVVPQPGRAVKGRGAVFEFLGGGLLKKIEGLRVRFHATAPLLVFGHDAHHLASLGRAHNGGAAVGPGEDEARVQAAAAHGVVTCTIGAADHDCDLWYPAVGDRWIILEPCLMMPFCSEWVPTMKPVVLCRNSNGVPA